MGIIMPALINIAVSMINAAVSVVLCRTGWRLKRAASAERGRIESVFMTREDYAIWIRHRFNYPLKGEGEGMLFVSRYIHADRRDQDLMHAHKHVLVRGSDAYAQIARCAVCRRVAERLEEERG